MVSTLCAGKTFHQWTEQNSWSHFQLYLHSATAEGCRKGRHMLPMFQLIWCWMIIVVVFTVLLLLWFIQRMGLQLRSFEDFIYSLNNQNYLLKKGPKLYQLQTSSCLWQPQQLFNCAWSILVHRLWSSLIDPSIESDHITYLVMYNIFYDDTKATTYDLYFCYQYIAV